MILYMSMILCLLDATKFWAITWQSPWDNELLLCKVVDVPQQDFGFSDYTLIMLQFIECLAFGWSFDFPMRTLEVYTHVWPCNYIFRILSHFYAFMCICISICIWFYCLHVFVYYLCIWFHFLHVFRYISSLCYMHCFCTYKSLYVCICYIRYHIFMW